MHTLSAEGVRHFPKPSLPKQESLPQKSSETQISSQSASDLGAQFKDLLASLSDCSACALSQGRNRVIAAHQFLPQKIMVVSDFPEPADELASAEEPLFTTQKSPHQVLQRLFNYLGISQSIHRSFAIKCIAPRGIPNTTPQTCARYLLAEINCVDPEVIICAGLRSARSVLSKTTWNIAETPELGEIGPLLIQGRFRKVLVVPASTELEANEKWRGPVGAFLKQALAQV
jgi:uracil-DNA glycosylase family 4